MVLSLRIHYAGAWYQEFDIGSYSTVSTITKRNRYEVVNNRRLKGRIEQWEHDPLVSQKLKKGFGQQPVKV